MLRDQAEKLGISNVAHGINDSDLNEYRPGLQASTVLHQLDQKIIYPHNDFKHLTEKYFEIGMKLNDFSIQLVKY